MNKAITSFLKKFLLQSAFLICAISTCLPAFTQGNDTSVKEGTEETLIKYFSKLDVDAFKGKVIDSFLSTVKHAYVKLVVEPSSDNLHQGVVMIVFPYNITAHVFVDEFRKANPYSMSMKKQARKVRQELIAAIEIRNESACIQGCD